MQDARDVWWLPPHHEIKCSLRDFRQRFRLKAPPKPDQRPVFTLWGCRGVGISFGGVVGRQRARADGLTGGELGLGESLPATAMEQTHESDRNSGARAQHTHRLQG